MIEELEKEYGNKKYKLPNGIEIPFKQYMLEYVVNYIDLTQNNITIKNGNSINMKQFIEEFVLDDCQKRYNGDLSKYLGEILLRKDTIEKVNDFEDSLNEIKEPDSPEDDWDELDLDNELSDISFHENNESFEFNNKMNNFSIENQKKFLNDNSISDEIKYQYFEQALDKKVLEEYLESNIDFTKKAINNKIVLNKILDNQINIPSHILDSEFYNNLEMFAKNDIEVFRNYINSMTRICDVSFLDETLNKRNDIMINSYDEFINIIKYFDVNSKDLNIKPNFLFTSEMQNYLNEIKNKILENIDEKNKSSNAKLQSVIQNRINKYTKKLENRKTEMLNELEKKLNEIIIDNLFKENIHNVMLNLNEIILYNNTLKDDDKVVDINNLNFYKLILNLENMNLEKKLEIYNKFKGKNIQEIYYDDIRNSKNDSYQKLGDSLMDVSKYKISEDLSNEYGCNIYDMRDENFIILTRCLNGVWIPNYNEFIKNKVSVESFTLISNSNTRVFSDDSIIYGYNNIDVNKINHITRRDASSLNYGRSYHDNSVSPYIDEILSPTQISKNFNEINISTLDENNNVISIKPSYIICKDKIDEKSVMAAKKLNLPIVLIKHKYLNVAYENGDYLERDLNFYSTLRYGQTNNKSR